MVFRWRKLGLIFAPSEAGIGWMASHAQLPVADHIGGDHVRVYFAARSCEQVSSIGSVVVELGDRPRVIDVSAVPALEPGAIGTFDEHGVFPSCIVNLPEGRKRMYYVGWNRGYRAPMFYASIGVAESVDDGMTWQKLSNAPVMARSEHDPCLVTSPHVMWHGDRYRMTYVSGVRWIERGDQLLSNYHIKYAESADGLRWKRKGQVAIDFADDDESNIARSWVLDEQGRLHMLFGYVRQGSAYRIGYAQSDDWQTWHRDDAAAGITVSQSGFDAEMVCYPNLIALNGRVYLLYNGNRFGAEGFGMAMDDR